MKKLIVVFMALMVTCCSACSKSPERPDTGGKKEDETKVSERNLERAVILIENAAKHYSKDGTTALSMTYNPFTSKPSDNLVSVWEYTSSIEAVTAAMNSMKAFRDAGNSAVYDSKYETFKSLLARLYAGLEYYKGTFELTSYTGTATWSPYGVHRASSPGTAAVAGIENVYDDQMWIIRELINAWRATGESGYLERAEYLTAYVLDGWDCTLNASGKENGGITWGPGYVTKHACSNSPMITPLVWLHEIYKGKSDEITYGVPTIPEPRKLPGRQTGISKWLSRFMSGRKPAFSGTTEFMMTSWADTRLAADSRSMRLSMVQSIARILPFTTWSDRHTHTTAEPCFPEWLTCTGLPPRIRILLMPRN